MKSVTTNEEPLRFHPTNPFYTTLPNYSSASKLPVPNGRASSIDRSKSRENTSSLNEYGSDLKSPSFFNKTYDSGPSSLPHSNHKDTGFSNGFSETKSEKDKSDDNFYDSKFSSYFHSESKSTGKNPFDTKRNSDPFEKYLRPENKINGKSETSAIINSHSDNNFHKHEEIKRSTITEHKINEVEEVKTVKKIILNGSGSGSDYERNQHSQDASNVNIANDMNARTSDHQEKLRKEKIFHIPIQRDADYFDTTTRKHKYDERNHNNLYQSTPEDNSSGTPTGKFLFNSLYFIKLSFYMDGFKV